MSLFDMMLGKYLPDADVNFKWHLAWLYEDDIGAPNERLHDTPQNALNHMIEIWNSPRTLVHISLSRRNA